MPPVLVGTILLGAVGGVGWRLAMARREIKKLRSALKNDRFCEAEKLAILQDANEALRDKIQSSQQRHGDLQQEFAALCYSVSHDLRTPLRSINGFSQALAEDYGPRLDPAAQEYLWRVRSGVQHLDTLIEEMLALSRIVRSPFHPREVDLTAVAWEIIGELSVTAPDRRVEWVVQPGIMAVGDFDLLTMVLRHLLGNAWKFTARRPRGRVSFRTTRAAAGTVYEIGDNGAGFDPRYAGKLFAMFQRLHSPEEFPGFGTGLATVQRIVRRHDGDVWATAEPDAGATLSFTLNVPREIVFEKPAAPLVFSQTAGLAAEISTPAS